MNLNRIDERCNFEFGTQLPPFIEQTRRTNAEVQLFHLVQYILRSKSFIEWLHSIKPKSDDPIVQKLLSFSNPKYMNEINEEERSSVDEIRELALNISLLEYK